MKTFKNVSKEVKTLFGFSCTNTITHFDMGSLEGFVALLCNFSVLNIYLHIRDDISLVSLVCQMNSFKSVTSLLHAPELYEIHFSLASK